MVSTAGGKSSFGSPTSLFATSRRPPFRSSTWMFAAAGRPLVDASASAIEAVGRSSFGFPTSSFDAAGGSPFGLSTSAFAAGSRSSFPFPTSRFAAGGRPILALPAPIFGASEGSSFCLLALIRGTVAMQSSPSNCSTWSRVLNTRSVRSRKCPNIRPRIIPPEAEIKRASRVLGWLFASGRAAGVIIRASVIGNDCC